VFAQLVNNFECRRILRPRVQQIVEYCGIDVRIVQNLHKRDIRFFTRYTGMGSVWVCGSATDDQNCTPLQRLAI